MTSIINNHMYNEFADSWWDENGTLHLLKVMVNPWRVPYFADAMGKHFNPGLNQVRLLDIGCGGGVLAEEFARLGCRPVLVIDGQVPGPGVSACHFQRLVRNIDARHLAA